MSVTLSPKPEQHALRAGVVQQRFDDFVVAELEQVGAAVDHRDLHAQRGEHDGVFQADHAAADDDHRPRHARQIEDLVGIENRFAVERNVRGPRGPRAGGQQDVLGLEDLPFAAAADFDAVRIDERRLAVRDVHAVAGELVLDDVPIGLRDFDHLPPQLVHRDLALAEVAVVVHVALAVAGEVDDRFANRLGRDRARVQRHAADKLALPLDDDHAPILLGGGDGRLLAGRPAAHHDQVVSHGTVPEFSEEPV